MTELHTHSNTNSTTSPVKADPMTPTTPNFEAPGPGSWVCGAQHCDRPMTRYSHSIIENSYRGFAESLEAYGSLLAGFECAFVHGFPYLKALPVGAPPDAKGPPPKLVFQIITRIHPEIRKRVRRAADSWESRPWRAEAARYREEVVPGWKKKILGLQRVEREDLSEAELIAHLEASNEMAHAILKAHHRTVAAIALPVGDFLVHAGEWTGRSTPQLLTVLSGASPASRHGDAELDALVDAIGSDPALRALVDQEKDPAQLIAALRAEDGAVGEAARRWIEEQGFLIVGLFELGAPTALEVPEMLVRALRTRLSGSHGSSHSSSAQAAIDELRANVPAEHRGEFDQLLDEAKLVYWMRDQRAQLSLWGCGVARHAVLEAGRRLHAVGRIADPEHALEFTHSELLAALRGETAPSADEVAAYALRRQTLRLGEAPENLGAPPSPPPPSDWLPAPAVRTARAFAAYVDGMFAEHKGDKSAKLGAAASPEVRGLAASGGRVVGRACLVLNPGDFAKVKEGDILVARMTTPSYNVLLPLLGGIVTDRGGVLSHPAIVSREYGLPGVVGTKNATRSIRDGDRIEVDGSAGTVRVLG